MTELMDVKVYAVSCDSPTSREGLEKTLNQFRDIEKGSLVCFPEYFLDSDLLDVFTAFAKYNQISLATGMIEKDGDSKYISGVIIDSTGKLKCKQRKLHPTRAEMKNSIKAGEIEKPEYSPYAVMNPNHTFFLIALNMCKDQWYFKTNKNNIHNGADIIFHPRGFGLNDPTYGNFYDNWLLLDRMTAILSKAYLIGTTGATGEAPLSDIIDFEGKVLAESNKEGVISATLDIVLRKKYIS